MTARYSIPIICALVIGQNANAGNSVDCTTGYARQVCEVPLTVEPDQDPGNPAHCKLALPEVYVRNEARDRATWIVFTLEPSPYRFDGDRVTLKDGSHHTNWRERFSHWPHIFGQRRHRVSDIVDREEDFEYDVLVVDPSYPGHYCKTRDPVIHNQN